MVAGHTPCSSCTDMPKDADPVKLFVHDRQKLLLIVLMLHAQYFDISINKYQIAVDQFDLLDWQTDSVDTVSDWPTAE